LIVGSAGHEIVKMRKDFIRELHELTRMYISVLCTSCSFVCLFSTNVARLCRLDIFKFKPDGQAGQLGKGTIIKPLNSPQKADF
jgi:hypothetical protein